MARWLEGLLFGLVYGLSWCVSILPRRLFYALADGVAFLLCYVVRYRRRVVQTNLRNSFPQRPEPELRRLAWAFYRHLADLFLEAAFLLHASARRIARRCHFVNVEVLEPHYRAGRSVVIAAAHYANWEFLTCAALYLKHTMLSIYKPLHNKGIERLITRSRERLGSRTVTMQDTLRTVARCQRDGEPVLVGLISDQIPVSLNQYWGRFLNQETLVYRGIEDIARRYDMPVYFCRMTQPRRGFYSIELELITETPRAHPRDEVTALHLAALERCIIDRPELWLWSHRRWKRKRPAQNQTPT